MADERTLRKIRRNAKLANVVDSYARELIERADEFSPNIEGKIRHKTGVSVKAFVENQRARRPELFQGPPIKTGSNANPWTLPFDNGGPNDLARIAYITRMGARAAQQMLTAAHNAGHMVDLAGRQIKAKQV